MRLTCAFLLLMIAGGLPAQQTDALAAAKALDKQILTLRSLDDVTRARLTRQLAGEIRSIPTADQAALASNLANLATEGDFGRDTLQYVTTTLDEAVRKYSYRPTKDGPARAYFQLALLARYEGMQVGLKNPEYDAAMKQLIEDDKARETVNFTLTDLGGKKWTFRDLRGKVVVVNFWATWCPPCRKEMPDLEAIYKRFKDRGLVILALSDEGAGIVKPFIENQQKVSYPILFDPGHKVADRFRVDGIPKTFIYNREGKLAAQSIDMRTMGQFLGLLKQAGME